MSGPWVHVTAAGLTLGTTAYIYVAHILSRRQVTGPSALALGAFRAWWYGLAVATGALAARNVLALSGVTGMPVHLALLQLFVLGNAVALAGLVTYLVILYTGSERGVRYVVALYVAYLLFYTWLLHYSDPVALKVGPVRTSFEYAGPASNVLVPALVLAFYVPQVCAAVFYGTLARRLDDATLRYRALLVSISILLWSVANMVQIVASESGAHAVEFVAQLLVILFPLGVLIAYLPPSAVRRYLHVRSALEPAAQAP